jgi:hypothetical protein
VSRLRSEEGFTVMEMVAAATVGFIVLAATIGLLESSLRLNTGVMAKTDAMQRGRLAMDSITQQLRSQVCLDGTTFDDTVPISAVLAGSTATSVAFYSDFTETDDNPVKRILTFDPAKSAIGVQTFTTTVKPPKPSDYLGAPSGGNLVLENAVLQKKDGADVPFLRYYGYTTVGGRQRADEVLTPPLDQDEANRVARIDVAFLALPTGSKDRERGVNLSNQVMARHADPNAMVYDGVTKTYVAAPDPYCL